jgi:spore maturation protein CgeB
LKVLYVGYHNPHFTSLTEYVERAIVQLGHDLETFDYRAFILPGRLRERFRPLDDWDTRRLNRELLDRVARMQPGLVLVNGGSTILPDTVAAMKGVSKTLTVNWIADFPLLFDKYLKAGPHYQYFFASGTDALKKYRQAGHVNGYWLPFACDPEIHRPVELSEEEKRRYTCDICFIGSNYTERVELLEKLTGFDLAIWGIGWNRLPPDSPLRRCVRGGMAGPDEWVNIYSSA